MKKKIGTLLFGILLCIFVVGVRPWRVFAQADTGYVKVGSSSSTSFTDTTLTNGNTYQWEITAFNGLESTPVKSSVATVPVSGTHNASLAWGASTTAGVTYNIYRTQVTVPNPPGAVSVTIN